MRETMPAITSTTAAIHNSVNIVHLLRARSVDGSVPCAIDAKPQGSCVLLFGVVDGRVASAGMGQAGRRSI
jgi:hypothetical protein